MKEGRHFDDGLLFFVIGHFFPVFLNETPESVLGNIHQQLLLV